MNDIVKYSKNVEQHDKLISEVLRRPSSNNMKLNVSKIQFCQHEVKFLGVTLNGNDIIISGIEKKRKPQSFLYRRMCLI